MKINKILTLFVLAGCILSASTSCSLEDRDFPVSEEAERVPVTLSLSIASMEGGTPETKTIMEPDIEGVETIAQQIKNFVVLQFEGSGTDAKLVALPVYYNNAAAVFEGTEQVRLLPSSQTNTIVVVANTFDNIYTQRGMTLRQFLAEDFSRIKDYAAVLTKDEGNDYLRMSGSNVETSIGPDTSIGISLKRNVSKITLKVKNDSEGDEKVTIQKLQLRDINAKYYYLTNILGEDGKSLFVDNYSAERPHRIDGGLEVFPEEGNNGVEQVFEYYVPANLRGETDSQYQYTKGLGAPEGATRFCLYGTYGASNTAINYTYYLGANLVNDFNLKPNYHYTYNITIHSKGDARYDYRIEDCKEVKFTIDANCYMVQPPRGEGQSRIYAIPVRRAVSFWHGPSNNGVYGANQFEGIDYSNYAFNPNTEWRAEVLWSDFQLNPDDFIVKKNGKGYDITQPDSYFKIKVPSGMKGNAVVAVKLGNSESIVWSWHIWITDYNPDRENLVPVNSTFAYGVEGGLVHRYDNASFQNGAYKAGFIMDRNLGASSASYDGTKGTLYYQFGRKDPFPGQTQGGEIGFFYKGGTVLTNAMDADYIIKRNGTVQPGMKNARYSVCNPMKFISVEGDESWTEADGIVSKTNPWFDPQYNQHDGTIMEKEKSIYDPCPPGWKVPAQEAWDGVSGGNWDNGLCYKPNSSVSVFFPAASYRSPADASLDSSLMGTEGKYWTATPSGANAYAFSFSAQSISVGADNVTANAFPLRCVKDEPWKAISE